MFANKSPYGWITFKVLADYREKHIAQCGGRVYPCPNLVQGIVKQWIGSENSGIEGLKD